MSDLNKCLFIGRLGKDPEQRFMPSGDAVVNFSLAVGESWKDKQGQKQERTEWVNVVAFGRLAEIMAQYLHRGSKVFISGKHRTQEYEKDGIKRYKAEIVVNEMQMLDPPVADQGQPSQPAQRKETAQAPSYTPQMQDFIDDEIPF